MPTFHKQNAYKDFVEFSVGETQQNLCSPAPLCKYSLTTLKIRLIFSSIYLSEIVWLGGLQKFYFGLILNYAIQKMEPELLSHGHCAEGKEWKQPKLVAKSDELSRPGYTKLTANQYVDCETVLDEKIKILAAMIKQSENCVVYTGAGISRAAGIADYASKAKKSVAGKEDVSLNRLNAQPTMAHYVLVGMEKKKYVKHWLQQNHDGLAQKAGFPLKKLNEIHGSWFDKKNPVVLMDDTLNPKNYKVLEEWQGKVDVCLALGTSLCGMRSDGIAKSSAQKGKLIIVNLQQTPYDKISALRIYGNLQKVIEKLGKELKIKPDTKVCITNPYQWNK